jgi:hypothetical protein
MRGSYPGTVTVVTALTRPWSWLIRIRGSGAASSTSSDRRRATALGGAARTLGGAAREMPDCPLKHAESLIESHRMVAS